MSATTNGRQKLIAAKLDLLGEAARMYAHGAMSLTELAEAARDYARVLALPLAKRTQYDHAKKETA